MRLRVLAPLLALAAPLVAAPALAQPAPPAEPPAQPPTEPTPEAPKPPEPEPEAPKPEAPKPEATEAPKPAPDPKKPEVPPAPPPAPEHKGSFEFGSYGRMIVATDGRGGPGRDADIVWYGTRMDEDNYAEIELRREDDWSETGIHTTIVTTLATQSPIFHYNAHFDIALAVRNLYIEAKDVGTKGLSTWAGSRMVRGDDLYLLNLWPLDNLNLLGAGVGYRHEVGTGAQLSLGATQPDSPFFRQMVVRPAPLNQFGSASVPLLDRQKFIGALRLIHNQRFGDKAKPGPGIKGVLYGEGHVMAEGRREPEPGAEDEILPSDGGFVVGGQFTAYTGVRDTFVHLYGRYAQGLAAYGQFGTPGQLALDKTTSGAHELLLAAGGNAEVDFFGVLLAAYVRSFRDASEGLNFEDVDEAAVVLRPSFWIVDWLGISGEGTFELAQRGVIATNPEELDAVPEGPRVGTMWRVGVMPFISPAGRGNFTRPQIRLIYNAAFRNDTARSFYPVDHPFFIREIEHFVGVGAEWWFNSTSYGF